MAQMSEGQSIFYCSSCLNTFAEDVEACPNLACTRQRPENGWDRTYAPGDVIDRNYQVINRLAIGGAGVTYLVRSLDDEGEMTGPLMALKLLFTARDHGAYLRRLSTEAQILQELHHPNIVQYLGFVHRTGHSPYLLTHFEEGGNLLDHMRRHGKFSIRHAAEVGRQVCWALEKGHAQGIIHRDLKPENLLLAESPRPGESPVIRVADFGIAKVSGSLNSGLTRAGAFVGTPQYAAPEQFLGEPASDKADVYSLGAVMYFLMTATPLVKDAHMMPSEDVYTRLMDTVPPVIRRQRESPEDVERINWILAHAMTLQPTDRCGVSEMDGMLANLLSGKEPLASSVTMPPDISETANVVSQAPERIPSQPATSPTVATSTPMIPSSAPTGVVGLQMFVYGTLGLVILGLVGWFAMLAWEGDAADDSVQMVEAVPPPSPVAEAAAEPVVEAVAEEPVVEAPAEPKAPARPSPPPVIDAVKKPSLGVDARKAALRAFKRNAQPIRKLCPKAVGSRIAIEAVVASNGRISWARPLDKRRPEFKCVTDNMKNVKSGSRLKMATKVRLHVEP